MSSFQQRQDRLQELLQGKAFITQDSNNIFYLTGFRSSFGIFFQSKTQKILISDSRYRSQGEDAAKKSGSSFHLYSKDFTKKLGEKVSGDVFVENSLSLDQFENLKKQFPNLKLFPQKSPVEKLREIKDLEEINKITHAQNHVDSVLFPFLKEQTKEGITEQELAYKLRIHLEDSGKYEMSFPIILAFGENSANPHSIPRERKLKKGDNILIDCGVKHQGYCCDMTRNAFFGSPNPEFQNHYQHLLEAQKSALKESIAGKKINEIDTLCRNLLGDKNQYFTHSLGHGVGLDIHEGPGVSEGNLSPLEENQVITIEPGLYYPGKFGIRIEDLLVITKESPQVLSKSSKDLLIL